MQCTPHCKTSVGASAFEPLAQGSHSFAVDCLALGCFANPAPFLIVKPSAWLTRAPLRSPPRFPFALPGSLRPRSADTDSSLLVSKAGLLGKSHSGALVVPVPLTLTGCFASREPVRTTSVTNHLICPRAWTALHFSGAGVVHSVVAQRAAAGLMRRGQEPAHLGAGCHRHLAVQGAPSTHACPTFAPSRFPPRPTSPLVQVGWARASGQGGVRGQTRWSGK